MINQRTLDTELLDVCVVAIERARKTAGTEIQSAQDAMINMRVDWEELQSRLRNRKIDGFEPAVDAMVQLAATSLAMAASLQAKIINQRLRQLVLDEAAAETQHDINIVKPNVRRKRKAVTK